MLLAWICPFWEISHLDRFIKFRKVAIEPSIGYCTDGFVDLLGHLFILLGRLRRHSLGMYMKKHRAGFSNNQSFTSVEVIASRKENGVERSFFLQRKPCFSIERAILGYLPAFEHRFSNNFQ